MNKTPSATVVPLGDGGKLPAAASPAPFGRGREQQAPCVLHEIDGRIGR